MAGSLDSSEFETLKQEIDKAIPFSDLSKIKHFFSSSIESRRTLSKIRTLPQMFFTLERRGALHKNDVSAFICLGEYLENSKIVELSKAYTKLIIEPSSCVCGRTKPCFEMPDLITPTCDIDISLQMAMNNLACNIGGKWRVLARELDVNECYIDEISEDFQNSRDQAMKSLFLWKYKKGTEATEGALKRALESRLCKLHGLGIHMLEKPVSIE